MEPFSPQTFSLLACVLYLAAAGTLAARLKRGATSLGAIILLVWTAALAVHAVGLNGLVFTRDGLDLAFFKAGSVTALLIAAMLLLSCLHKPLGVIALFVLPVTALFTVLGGFDTHRVISADANTGIRAHVLSSLLAYSVLGLAGAQAIVLHVQNRKLRDPGPEPSLQTLLPPLDVMESFLFHLLTLGFVLLTLGLATGWIYHQDLLAQHLVHKTVLSVAAWLMFAALFIGRRFLGWRGETAVKITLIGLGLLIVAYFGSKLVLEYILQYV